MNWTLIISSLGLLSFSSMGSVSEIVPTLLTSISFYWSTDCMTCYCRIEPSSTIQSTSSISRNTSSCLSPGTELLRISNGRSLWGCNPRRVILLPDAIKIRFWSNSMRFLNPWNLRWLKDTNYGLCSRTASKAMRACWLCLLAYRTRCCGSWYHSGSEVQQR